MKHLILDSQILTTLMACPRKADLRFNQDLVRAEGKSNSLEAGSLAHFINEHFNLGLIAGLPRQYAIDRGMEAGKEYLNDYSPTNKYLLDENHKAPNTLLNPEYKTDISSDFVFQTMEEYFDYYKNDSWNVISAEETRQRLLYEDSELKILWKAKFDQIVEMSSGMISVDTKTMKQRRLTERKNNQFIGQCFILGSRSIIINKIGFQKSLKAHEKFERATISYSADNIAEWINDIVPHYANMLLAYTEAGNFPPNFTQCESKFGLCEYNDLCSDDRSLREESIKLNFVKTKKWSI